MASDQKFSDWYFTFCEAHNRTPSQEEVWNAALAQPAPVQAGAQQAVAWRNVAFNLYDATLPQATEHSTSYGGQWSSPWCVAITSSGHAHCEKFIVSESQKEMLDRGERPHSNWHNPGWEPKFVAWAYCKDVIAALAAPTQAGAGDAKGGA